MHTTVSDLIISDLITLVVSLVAAVWASGVRWGKMESKLTEVNTRLARIEGMFELKLRELWRSTIRHFHLSNRLPGKWAATVQRHALSHTPCKGSCGKYSRSDSG